ncbi:MAG TPA: TRAP transporter large permease subunit [Hyphomicrobiaceae bacterium]|nr:TRAP transporter large permease subunit [Hyphomicrobiaceae bacterium]
MLLGALTEAGGVNPVHMGVVLIATLAFGLITPPYGIVLLMGSKCVGVRFSPALRAARPIYLVFSRPSHSASRAAARALAAEARSSGLRHFFPNPNGCGYICPQ